MLLAFLFAATAPQKQTVQKPSALVSPLYRWETIAVCAKGVVLARLPVYPGRLGIMQDLGCDLTHVDIDARAASFAPMRVDDVHTQQIALWAVPLEWPKEPRGIAFCNADACIDAVLPVGEVPYPKSEITVSSKFMAPSAEQEKKIQVDRMHIAHAWTLGVDEQLYEGRFLLPRPPNYTSVFGALRIINGKTHTRHLGTDFDGQMGEPITSVHDGLVVLAEDLFYSGNSVFVTHGPGLFTTYFHMTKIAVKPGQYVKAGQLLGSIGRTGRVTGPHLHFSAKLWGHYFEPMELFDLDFTDLW